MRLLYAPGLSDRFERIEAFRVCINGARNEAKGAADVGAERQYAVSADIRGGIFVRGRVEEEEGEEEEEEGGVK